MREVLFSALLSVGLYVSVLPLGHRNILPANTSNGPMSG